MVFTFCSCCASLVGPFIALPNHSMFQFTTSSVVAGSILVPANATSADKLPDPISMLPVKFCLFTGGVNLTYTVLKILFASATVYNNELLNELPSFDNVNGPVALRVISLVRSLPINVNVLSLVLPAAVKPN